MAQIQPFSVFPHLFSHLASGERTNVVKIPKDWMLTCSKSSACCAAHWGFVMSWLLLPGDTLGTSWTHGRLTSCTQQGLTLIFGEKGDEQTKSTFRPLPPRLELTQLFHHRLSLWKFSCCFRVFSHLFLNISTCHRGIIAYFSYRLCTLDTRCLYTFMENRNILQKWTSYWVTEEKNAS